ncbi:diacylglycerol/lipid kinase family protein [Cohnella caldifontis]|uniref:diacylglycerol/lipid kinase family protein n=1 Tax=Cohnella caldifontis TaxID=3027471 RepID=UPI0023EAFE96|nr:diacylglycerol kinase family protein [Cohnella sp. YIM B05605]
MILFVVNEASGNGRGGKTWGKVERMLTARGTPYAKISAASADDAVRRAEAFMAQTKVDALAAVGGDGTVHGLVSLALRTRTPLGLIPCGSGNDTALAFGVPNDPAIALDIVLAGVTRPSDVLMSDKADGSPEYSLISIATGLDGAVAEDVNGSRYKRWCNRIGLGRLAYIIGLLRKLATYRPQKVRVTVDGATREFADCWLAAVANLATYGGGLRICPDARPDDGRLHACVVHGCNALQLLSVFPTVLTGRHVRSRFVTMLQGSQIAVESPIPMLAYGDGEPSGRTPLRASVLPGQLLILTSSGWG